MRRALQSAADEFFKNSENDSSKKESRMKIFRRSDKVSVERRVEQRMRQADFQNFDDVRTLVEEMGDGWKEKHGKVNKCFHRICGTLDAHKAVLSVVPNQNVYAQVLSGALVMVVQASVYHAEIAENLAIATAHLCERVAVCAQLVEVIQTRAMKRQLASIFTSLFLFLLKVARWFNKSSSGRFFDSFNTAVKQEHDEAIAAINQSIDVIMEQGGVEELVRMEYLRRTVDIIEWKLENSVMEGFTGLKESIEALSEKVDKERIRNIWQNQKILDEAGRLMIKQLETMFDQKMLPWRDSQMQAMGSAPLQIEDGRFLQEAASQDESWMTREAVDMRCKVLEAYVHGTDGLALAQESHAHFMDMNVLYRIKGWIQESTSHPQKLWIEFPFEYQQETSARVTALGVIAIAAKSNAPFISYICHKPNKGDIPKSQTREDAGVLALVCGLILQLLRFRPMNDGFRINAKALDSLSDEEENWHASLDLLGLLLDHTPVLRYCIIHGLNELESGEGDVKVKAFLRLLFSKCLKPDSSFGLLLTTTGQSRVLASAIQREERERSDATIGEVSRRGQDFRLMQTG